MSHPACQLVFPLFLAHREELRRYVVRQIQDPGLAEDLISDLGLKLYDHCGRIPTLRNPRAWLFRLAAHAVADHYRQAQREQQLRAELPSAEASPSAVDPEAAEHCLRCLLGELPERYQVPLTLVELMGLSQKEAARRLDLPYSTLKSRVQRGRAQLRDHFETRCGDVLSS